MTEASSPPNKQELDLLIEQLEALLQRGLKLIEKDPKICRGEKVE